MSMNDMFTYDYTDYLNQIPDEKGRINIIDRNIVPKEYEERITQDIKDKYEFARNERVDVESKWKELYDLYKFKYTQDNLKFKTRSKLFIAKVFKIIEVAKARIIGQFLNTPDFFEGVPIFDAYSMNPVSNPTNPDEIMKLEAIVKKKMDYFRYQLSMMKFYMKITPTLNQFLMFGDGMVKIMWDMERRRPNVVPVNIFDVYIDPSAKNIEGATYIIHRLWLTKEQLIDRVLSQHYDKDNVAEMIEQKEGDNAKQIGVPGIFMDGYNNGQEQFEYPYDDTDIPVKFNRYEILEYWVDGAVITIGNRQFLLRASQYNKEYGYPIVQFSMNEGFKLYGTGFIEPIKDLQKEYNIKRNQMVDFLNQKLARMYGVRRGMIDDLRQLKIRQNGLVITNNNPNEALMPLPTPDIPQGAFMTEDNIERDMMDVSGVYDTISGGSASTTRKTKFEVEQKAQAASTRFEFAFQVFAERLLVVFEKMMLLNRDNLQADIFPYKNLDEVTYVPITPPELGQKIQLVLKTSFMNSVKQEKFQKIMTLYNILVNDRYINQLLLRKLLINEFDLTDQMEDLLLTPEGMQQQASQEMNMGGQPSKVGEPPPEIKPSSKGGQSK